MSSPVFDNSSSTSASSSHSITWSHTVSGVNRVLIVNVSLTSTTADRTISSVTYNGVTMTALDTSTQFFAGVVHVRGAMFILINPDVGTNSIVVTLSANADRIVCTAASYTNADTTAQPDTHTLASQNSSSKPSGDIITVTDGALVVAALAAYNSNPGTASDTLRESLVNANVAGALQDTNGGVSPAGDRVLSWGSNENSWIMTLVAIKPYPVNTSTQDSSAKASITATSLQENSVKTDILQTDNRENISVKAHVLVTNTKLNSVKANILVMGQSPQYAKANIVATSSQDNSVKANILVQNTTGNNSVKVALIGVLDQFSLNTLNNAAFIGSTTGQRAGQQFTPSASRKVSYAVVQLTKLGSPTDNIICDLYELDSFGFPTSKIDTATNQIVASTVSAFPVFTYVQFNFSGNINLRAGTKYAFIFSRTGSLNNTDVCGLGDTNSGTDYTGGNIIQYNGSSWSNTAGFDAFFLEYYNNQGSLGSQDGSIKANILVVDNVRSTSAKANVLVSGNTVNNSVKANIVAVTVQDNNVKAHILVTISHEMQVKSNILIAGNSDNNSVKANIPAEKKNSTKANLFAETSKANSVKADILTPGQQSNSVKADILASHSQDNHAKANITVTTACNQYIKSDIWNTYTINQDTKTDIKNTYNQQLTVKADLKHTYTSDNRVKADILIVDTINNNSVKADITNTYAAAQFTKANILVSDNTDRGFVKTNIQNTYTAISFAKADIIVITTKENRSKSDITSLGQGSQSVKADILVTDTITSSRVKVNILNTYRALNYVKANIQNTYGVDNHIKANVSVPYPNMVKANIIHLFQLDVFAKSNIDVIYNKKNNVIADILTPYNLPSYNKANILAYQSSVTSAKANIPNYRVCDVSTKSNIFVKDNGSDQYVKSNIIVVYRFENSAKMKITGTMQTWVRAFIHRVIVYRTNPYQTRTSFVYTEEGSPYGGKRTEI